MPLSFCQYSLFREELEKAPEFWKCVFLQNCDLEDEMLAEQLLKVQGYHSPNLWKKVSWRDVKVEHMLNMFAKFLLRSIEF